MSALGEVGAGHTLGRYELLVPIAQGGMAVVWAARMKGTRGFQKTVAVKTMLPELSEDPQFEEMFLAEAGLASRIKHPHVCEILDLGEQEGLIYIVMEWIDGEPLSQLARSARQKGGVPILVALRLVLNAALGLHAAHELKDEAGNLVGLVHRDVSPQNILVTYDGVVKIVDFGVAKASSELSNAATKDGQLKGKVPFMSPEQALGKEIDRRTDVFALGIVLFQLLAAKHPFRGDNDMITLRRICDKEPSPTLASAIPNCPPLLNDVVAKALAKDVAERYQSMAEFARAIDRAIAELKLQGLPDEDVVGFVKGMLGERAEKRRAAIREGIKTADERAEQRQQEKAQHAAMLAQLRASGATPSNMPPPLLSIPPPPVAPVGESTSQPPAAPTSTSSSTHKAMVADLAPAANSGKKKLAVVAFGAVGLAAIGAAVVLAMRPPPAPANQPAANTTETAKPVPTAVATPTATQSAVVPASAIQSAEPAVSASATPSAAAPTTKAITTSKPSTNSIPITKATATTKSTSGSLPSVRDPGF
ncbi:MAG: protein kinase [Polyangiaceae bacterium]|nr:protein kinase [Polyangiaceae bacterium]